jgi:hypothetical protein
MVLVLLIKDNQIIKRIRLNEQPKQDEIVEFVEETGSDRAVITKEYIKLPFE